MTHATYPPESTVDRKGARASAVVAIAAIAVVALLIGLPTSVSTPHGPSSAAPAPSVHVTGATGAPAASSVARGTATTPEKAPAPASSAVFNPPCYPIDLGVCVSIAQSTEPNIVPPLGTFVSATEPNSTTDLPLVIKSRVKLDWPSAAHYGQKSPILLNVSANLWNGDPYYSIYQGDYYHGANPQQVWNGPTVYSSNASGYIYWYNVSIAAKTSTNVRAFFPGETVTWWIELTYNVSYTYTHHESPHFVFTYSGAWPYSPYPGSNQYAGSTAIFQDVQLTVTPTSPNWNDSVSLVLNTTQPDLISNATIGAAYVDLSETNPLGAPQASGTLTFPVVLNGAGVGVTSTSVKVPASYAQTAGSTVTFVVTVYDAAGDQLTTPASSWIVGGNGSFLSGVFVDDLELNSTPTSVLAGFSMLNPGLPVNLTLTSRNAGTAISSAEIVAQITYPILHETVTQMTPFTRVSSTIFQGSLPGFPLGAFVNFTVYAWDFNQRLEVSPQFGYYTPDFQTYDPVPEQNSSFFYVLVYDNGTHEWVNGVQVQVLGAAGSFNSVGNTTLGLSYPNQTRNIYLPLLVAANASYRITVFDPYFVPSGSSSGGAVSISVLALHSMTLHQTLAQGADYTVVQEGNEIVFWLNSTAPAPQKSPSVPGGTVPVAGALGIVAVSVASVPLSLWWLQIRRRRKEEEKRVTL